MTNLNPIKIADYKSREERMKSIDGFSLRSLFSFANIATVLFVALDFAVLFTRWETVQTEAWYMVALIAVSSAVILDVPMMLAGKTIVEYQNKLRSKSSMALTVSLSAFAFLLVFSFSIWFSYVTRTATFQDADTTTLVNNAAEPVMLVAEESLSVLVAALYSGILPLGTSVASLVIALITYKPVEEKRKRIAKARAMAEEHLLHLKQGIAEGQARIKFGKTLLSREEDLYNQFVESVYAQELIRKNAYREALEEMCSLDDVNHIIESAKAMNEARAFNDGHFRETQRALSEDRRTPFNEADNIGYSKRSA